MLGEGAAAGRLACSPAIKQVTTGTSGCIRTGGDTAGGRWAAPKRWVLCGGGYTLPSIRAIHQLQGMMIRQMTLPPW